MIRRWLIKFGMWLARSEFDLIQTRNTQLLNTIDELKDIQRTLEARIKAVSYDCAQAVHLFSDIHVRCEPDFARVGYRISTRHGSTGYDQIVNDFDIRHVEKRPEFVRHVCELVAHKFTECLIQHDKVRWLK
jgi:hypothetical protein